MKTQLFRREALANQNKIQEGTINVARPWALMAPFWFLILALILTGITLAHTPFQRTYMLHGFLQGDSGGDPLTNSSARAICEFTSADGEIARAGALQPTTGEDPSYANTPALTGVSVPTKVTPGATRRESHPGRLAIMFAPSAAAPFTKPNAHLLVTHGEPQERSAEMMDGVVLYTGKIVERTNWPSTKKQHASSYCILVGLSAQGQTVAEIDWEEISDGALSATISDNTSSLLDLMLLPAYRAGSKESAESNKYPAARATRG